MGKKLLFICLAFFTFNLIGQDLQIRDSLGADISGDTITFTHVIDNDSPVPNWSHKGFVSLYNNTNSMFIVKLTRIEHQIVSGTEEYYCYGQSCLAPKLAGVEPVRTSTDTLHAKPNSYIDNSTNPFTVYIDPNRFGGISLYEYRFEDTENPNTSASIFVKWIINHKVGLKKTDVQYSFNLGPNPASDQTRISFNKPLTYAQQSIQIFDILGKVVKEITLNSGVKNALINVEDLKSGIYFINLIGDGQKIISKKLIVQ